MRAVPARPKVLVTGAGGFVGGRLVEAAWLGEEFDVRAGVRRWHSAARIARFPVEIIECDVTNPVHVRAALDGVDAVVHCAKADDPAVTVEGTKNLLEASRELGVERVVYLSTADVYGYVAGDITEAEPLKTTGNDYADSKIEAERLCRDASTQGVRVDVLRPSIVYGPFSESWSIGIAERLQSGHWSTFEEFGDGACNLVYVDDLVSAIFLAIRSERGEGEAFNINGPDRLTWNEYFQRFNQTLGRPELSSASARSSVIRAAVRDRISSVASFMTDRFGDQLMDIYLSGGLPSKVMKRIKRDLYINPSSLELSSLFGRNAFYPSTKAEEILEYAPSFRLETGLALTTAWLEHHGYLKKADLTAAGNGDGYGWGL